MITTDGKTLDRDGYIRITEQLHTSVQRMERFLRRDARKDSYHSRIVSRIYPILCSETRRRLGGTI